MKNIDKVIIIRLNIIRIVHLTLRRINQMSDKTRVSVTMTPQYISALDSLVNDGLYLNRGEAILDALRVFLRKEKIEPFFSGNTRADANATR